MSMPPAGVRRARKRLCGGAWCWGSHAPFLVGRLLLRERACTRTAAADKGLVLEARQVADVHPSLQRTRTAFAHASQPRAHTPRRSACTVRRGGTIGVLARPGTPAPAGPSAGPGPATGARQRRRGAWAPVGTCCRPLALLPGKPRASSSHHLIFFSDRSPPARSHAARSSSSCSSVQVSPMPRNVLKKVLQSTGFQSALQQMASKLPANLQSPQKSPRP